MLKRNIVRFSLLCIVFLVSCSSSPKSSLPNESRVASVAVVVSDSPVAMGRIVYRDYGCQICHGVAAEIGMPNPNSQTKGKILGLKFVAEGFTKSELRKKIMTGTWIVPKKDPNGPVPPFRMPAWKGYMSDRELNDVVEYLYSLMPEPEEDDDW